MDPWIERLANILYEMFLTDPDAPKWEDVSENDKAIWIKRAEAIEAERI